MVSGAGAGLGGRGLTLGLASFTDPRGEEVTRGSGGVSRAGRAAEAALNEARRRRVVLGSGAG